MLIGGTLVPARSGRTFEVVNPATEEIIGVVADGGAEDLDDALTRPARRSTKPTGRPTWSFGSGDFVSCERHSRRTPTKSGR